MTTALAEGTALGNGRYVVRRRLGSGGAAVVWLAEDTVLERPVAVKVLSEALADDESWMARFTREARVAASLSHPNLVSVYDFGADSERPYIVMEYMPGGSLYERVAAGEQVDPKALARDLLAALEAIHCAGVIHRDIKPGNVLLSADGTACLTDFGVARPEDATSLTQTGHIPGTGKFMAPELWAGHPADERTDLFAAGVLLRLAGAEGASGDLDRLIESLTSRERSDRPASAREALAMLGDDETPTAAPLASAIPADDERSPQAIIQADNHPHRRAAFAGLALLGVVAVLAITQAFGGGDDPTPSSNSGEQAAPSNSGPGSEESSGNSGPEGSGSGSSGGDGSSAPEAVPSTEEAAALNEEAYALIQAGDPESAIPLLRQAVAAYPDGSQDLAYGYALYNLGNALHLSGKSKQAIPILEERLTINDQLPEVRATLAAAQAAAGQEPGSGDD